MAALADSSTNDSICSSKGKRWKRIIYLQICGEID